MKIALVTTRASLEENKRIAEEVVSLGHEFREIDLINFEYSILKGELAVPEFKEYRPDVIIVRGIFNSVKSIATYIKGLRKDGIKVFDNNFFEHLYSINKIADFLKLAQSGIPMPDTFHLHAYDKFLPSAGVIGYPVICKLARTGKGAGVYKFDNEVDLQNFVTEMETNETDPRSYLLQKFIDYKFDLRILVIGNEMFCMRRIPGENEFRANFSLGGSVELFDLDEKGKKMALDALHAVDLSVGGVDMLITANDERYILEVNHTAGFMGMEKATGVNIGKLFVEHAINNAK